MNEKGSVIRDLITRTKDGQLKWLSSGKRMYGGIFNGGLTESFTVAGFPNIEISKVEEVPDITGWGDGGKTVLFLAAPSNNPSCPPKSFNEEPWILDRLPWSTNLSDLWRCIEGNQRPQAA